MSTALEITLGELFWIPTSGKPSVQARLVAVMLADQAGGAFDSMSTQVANA